MVNFFLAHQLNIMLILGGICGMAAVTTFIMKFLTNRKRFSMMMMGFGAMLLLFSDRFAYIYRGDTSELGFIMTRVSNFLVYFMTLVVILAVNKYVIELIIVDCGATTVPKLLRINDVALLFGMFMVVISQFTGFYYTFDETNHYVRAPGFILCYVIPVMVGMIQLIVTLKYFDRLDKKVSIPLILFTVSPIVAGGVQVLMYGVSLTNIVLAFTVLLIYTFGLAEMNQTVSRAHKIEVEAFEHEKKHMKLLFDQTATAFVTAVEKKDLFSQGHSARVASIAREIAERSGKSEEFCNDVYYAALLHDVGMIGIPDRIIEKETELEESEYEMIKQVPVMSSEILSGITEYPFLRESALYSNERYDGGGYPEGLTGEEIPEMARILAVAKAYDSMTSRRRFKDIVPIQIVREEFIKEAGIQFDPEFAEIMTQMIDYEKRGDAESMLLTEGLTIRCENYRSAISEGIPITETVTEISFRCEPAQSAGGTFAAPSIILFDSYDRMVHDNPKSIEAYRYLEYGEVWFDGHMVSTAARNMKMIASPENPGDILTEEGGAVFIVTTLKIEDHIRVRLTVGDKVTEVIVALPESSRAACVGLTGENCVISDINIEKKEEGVFEDEIGRISEEIRYIDRMEADVPNVQVDRDRSVATQGILIEDDTKVIFHTMSLPSANLVWHCPYVSVFYSSDGTVGGNGYREYALIKLNGEYESDDEFAENKFSMKKTQAFPGWNGWKEIHKNGLECTVEASRTGNRVRIKTDTLGIQIEDTIRVFDGVPEVYLALTGDKVALTDIRIK